MALGLHLPVSSFLALTLQVCVYLCSLIALLHSLFLLFCQIFSSSCTICCIINQASHIQEKTNRLHNYAKQVCLKINNRKTGLMSLNVQDPAPVKMEMIPCHTQTNSHILVVLLDMTEEQKATSATELVRPCMPSGC